MRAAEEMEDRTEKSAVTPGPLAPAHELTGDMLMELKRPKDAFVEYGLTLAKEPGRFRSLYGAMAAARASGNARLAREYAAKLP